MTRRSADAYPDFQSVTHQPTGFSRWSLSFNPVLPADDGNSLDWTVAAVVATPTGGMTSPSRMAMMELAFFGGTSADS